MKNIAITRPLFLLVSCIGLLTITHGVLSDEHANQDDRSQITELILQRTSCFGLCPVDTLILRADGTSEFSGEMHAARTGNFKATFNKGTFKWLDSEDFFEMKDSYGQPNVDVSDHIISVVRTCLRSL